MSGSILETVSDRLADLKPERILIVGPVPETLVRHCRTSLGEGCVREMPEVAVAALDGLGRFPLALLGQQEPDRPPKDIVLNVLSRLRDVHCDALLFLAPLMGGGQPGAATGWTSTELVALGFHERRRDERAGLALYEFRLTDYKRTPDWLNPRHWANPERWDKERW